MLSTYMQTITQQQPSQSITDHNTQPHFTLSYDLKNYQSLLTHIAQDSEQRWILFIAPPGKPNITFLQQAGIHKNRIITVPQSKIGNQTELLKAALKSANYSTVITWLTDCNTNLQNELNTLATQSKSNCFVYCTQ